MSKRLVPSMAALQCFEAVARHLSFTRAADELHLTQSAVSKQVAHLEEQLQHLLFRRVRRRLQLTPAGELYQAEVRKILTQIDISSRYILSYGGQTEVLTIATQPTFGSRWLIPHLRGFGQHHPEIHLDIRNELEPFDLLNGRADIAFFYGQGTWPGAECVELFGESLLAVCAPALLGRRKPPGLDAPDGPTLLQCASRPEAWHDWFSQQDLHTHRSYHGPRFDTFYMCIHAAVAGCGVALVPDVLVREEIAEKKLVAPWPRVPASEGRYFMAYAERAAEVPKIRRFVDWVRQAAADENTKKRND
ncbi:MAG: LysR family transcriptional regulator [Achromobacter sp.]